MGKPAAKTAHSENSLRHTWEAQVDVLSRAMNNNQTVGIPIGPDTSRLLAEVILSRIDVELEAKFCGLKGIRFIDDYEFAFATRSEAESVLSHLQHLLHEFELALNPTKTAIIELPDVLDPPWTSKIRVFLFRAAGAIGQKHDLLAYFNMVFECFKQFPEEGLVKYAIGRLKGEEILDDNWPFLESILAQCVLIEPACIPQVCEQITYYDDKGYDIARALWSECLNRIVYERVPLGHSSEAAWAMWLMKRLNIDLSDKSAEAVGQCNDSIVALMALGLADIGLAEVRALSGLNRFAPHSNLKENQWLLCYQGNLMGWLGSASSSTSLGSDPAFSYLRSKGISFFDIEVTPPPANRNTAGSGGGGSGY